MSEEIETIEVEWDDVKGSIASIEEYLKHAQASVNSAFAMLSILKKELQIEERKEDEEETPRECDDCFEEAEPDSDHCASCASSYEDDDYEEEDEEEKSGDSPDDEFGM